MNRFAWLGVPLLGLPLLAASLLGLPAASGLASGTPAPSGQVAEGQRLYMENCALCHGADGQRGAAYQTPIWGPRAQIRRFETALGLFEYNQVTMPFNEPTQIDDVQKLAVVAFILANHGAMPANATLEYAKAAEIVLK